MFKIINKLDKEYLDKKLELDIKNKYIEGEQWFKNPELWYELTSFSNPYITIYSELVLLIQSLDKISAFLSNKDLIFYGLGTGDTELILVNSILSKEKSINVVGIEVQKQFIKGFIQSLKNISFEDKDYKINFLGINGLFQDIKKDELKISNNKKAHIILGNTFGNFREEEIFEIFNRLIDKGDILLLGFQTDAQIQKIFNQYSKNKMFNKFIKKSIPNCKKLSWKVNKDESQIEAWYGDILVFHSKKQNPIKMIDIFKKFNFENLYTINDNNSAIQIFKKINS